MTLPGRSQNTARRTCLWPLFCKLTALGLLVSSAIALRAANETAALVGQKLHPASGPRGKTMFTQLPPESTGVRTENQYADPQMTGALFRQYNGGSIGTGVTIGDFDNDGRPDIFVVSKTESCRLFRNLGGFSNEAFGGEDVELARRLKHLARTTRKRFVILHRHPVVTSARRMRLYTARQQIGQFRLLYYIIFDPHHATKDGEAARIWYDGRRW